MAASGTLRWAAVVEAATEARAASEVAPVVRAEGSAAVAAQVAVAVVREVREEEEEEKVVVAEDV